MNPITGTIEKSYSLVAFGVQRRRLRHLREQRRRERQQLVTAHRLQLGAQLSLSIGRMWLVARREAKAAGRSGGQRAHDVAFSIRVVAVLARGDAPGGGRRNGVCA